MAQPTIDGLTLNAGSGGSSLAGDTVATKFWQAVLVGFSTGDGAASVVMADTGLPVAPATGASWAITAAALPLPTGAATAANQATEIAHLSTLAGTVSAGVVAVGIAGQTGAVAVSGTFWQAVQPVSLAAVPSHEVTIAAAQTIAVTNAGTFAVQAAQSGTWNVGTVTGITNVVHVDDNGAALTVDGTITANAGTNLNTSALALEAGGNLAAAATSLAIVDDWDSSDDCRSIPQSAAAMDGATRCAVKRFRVKCGNGANTLIAAVSGKKFRIRSLAMLATSATAVTVYLSTTTDTGVLGDATDPLKFDLDGGDGPAGVILSHNPDGWLQTSTANEALTATLSAAEEVWIFGSYIEVA